jgi:hypothetical protein
MDGRMDEFEAWTGDLMEMSVSRQSRSAHLAFGKASYASLYPSNLRGRLTVSASIQPANPIPPSLAA